MRLRTVNELRFVSDNAGIIAFDAPEFMGRETWLFIEGPGYGVPPDGFGYRGVRITPQPGATLKIEVRREQVAKRLGRLTGAGLFGEAQRFGEFSEWTESGVLGSDSVQIARYRDRVYWLWGDTNLSHYPLGRFHMTGATTEGAPIGETAPPVRPRFRYWRGDDGLPRNTSEMPGSGPTWVSGFVALPDAAGRERLVGTYVKIQAPLTEYEIGLCVWDDDRNRFVGHRVLWERGTGEPRPVVPDGHPAFWMNEQGERELLLGDPFPRLRLPANFESWNDPTQWIPIEARESATRRDGGGSVRAHRGSIAWSAYREKWVTVFTELGGTPSHLGELWYAEAATPFGPWINAIRVVSHENYTVYNPRIHAETRDPASPVLLFEATYTKSFANRPHPTARQDYNQVLYRLDLDDPAFRFD